MAIDICLAAEDDGTFSVKQDGTLIQADIANMDDAIRIMVLLVGCQSGNQNACRELDARGIRPPLLALDPATDEGAAHVGRR